MSNWHDTLGELMLISGIGGMFITLISALRRSHSQR
jgi:hypothetical protein